MDVIEEVAVRNEKKIVLFVLDGVGGLPMEEGGKTELEAASTPNLDALAASSECGLHLPLGVGITPGSAPGHLALFGYDPFAYPIGRGVVAALGIGFPIETGDVAARMNFATQDDRGLITDRRAGRIPTERCAELCEMLRDIEIPDVTTYVKPVKDYRAVVVFRGPDLSDEVADTDPQRTGVTAEDPKGSSEKGARTAAAAKEFIHQANAILKNESPTNAVLMRGFAELPQIPSMQQRFKLNPLALAVYPDYRGVSRLVGMTALEDLKDLDDQEAALRANWQSHDFFFVHHKYTDSTGEDGNFDAKVSEIEKADAFVPKILDLKPDVLVVTGDHSTPSLLKSHSSHPIPFIISSRAIRADTVKHFGERSCAAGLWGILGGSNLIRIALAYAEKLMKFGA
jgi:2,3-bisphosphoglycerate-independent phosphoglycerate mutase